MVTEAEAVRAKVTTVKVALVVPAGMVTLTGTVATAVLALDRETSAPPLGACAFSVTDDSLAEVGGPGTTPTQEYKQSETARSPIATPMSGRPNEFRL